MPKITLLFREENFLRLQEEKRVTSIFKTILLKTAYIFFVINKFDLIRRKERCKMDILNQIKAISPKSVVYKEHRMIRFLLDGDVP